MIHILFETLAVFTGVQYYHQIRRHSSHSGLLHSRNFPVVVGCLLGAALGNKIVFWLEFPHMFEWSLFIQGGQSMVGGLLGGLIGVEVSKFLFGIHRSTGDDFVYPILLGLMIGRMGCFVSGLSDDTYGNMTNLPWGVDFGDGIFRHPTQLYEIVFAGLLWVSLRLSESRLSVMPGLRFKMMLCAYLLWRLCIDSIKPIPFAYFDKISGIQLTCALALIIYFPLTLRQFKRLSP